MTLQRLTRISLLAALCVALRQAFAPFPNVQPISAIFFLLVIFEGYSFAFLVMMITMFVSAFFLGMSLIVFFQIVAFGCLMLLWRISYKWLPFVLQILFVGLLSFAYGILIDSVYALMYHIPWWTYALVNGFSFNLAHALSTIIFYPIIYQIFRRFYVALLLASCAPSHSTNNQTTASSTEVAKKNEISITISVTPEGQKAQSKTLKVAEESNLMKVLKANYKIEEKNGMITSIDGHSQDEAKGLYWMYKINGEMAPKGAAETTVKKGDKIEFYQEVYQ